MYPYVDDNDRRKQKKPFDFFGIDDDFERLFRQMERMWERAFKDLSFDYIEPGRSFVHGFNINIGPDGKPRIQEFGHRPQRITDSKNYMIDERDPLTDVIEGEKDVSITIEIPGVDKQDIDLNVTENALEINVDNPKRKYHKVIDLPCDVFPDRSSATYNNGVLDVIVKRKERKKDGQGFHVNIE